MSFAENIKRIREKHGLTQTDLGAIAGVSNKAVSTWENGLKVPRMGAIEKMATYFNVTKSQLIFGDEPQDRTKPAAVGHSGLSPEQVWLMDVIRERPEVARLLHDIALSILKHDDEIRQSHPQS